jgi:hypothetical protein
MIYSQLEETPQRLNGSKRERRVLVWSSDEGGLINLWHPAAYIRASVSAPNQKPKKGSDFYLTDGQCSYEDKTMLS